MEQQNSLDNAGRNSRENSGNEEILERIPIDKTPLHIMGNEKTGYAISFGKYRLGELRESKEVAELDLIEEFWNIAARMCGVIADITIEQHRKEIDAAIKRHVQGGGPTIERYPEQE